MKLTQTGLPFSEARSIVPPPTCGTTSAGAGSPTWKPEVVEVLALEVAAGFDGAAEDAAGVPDDAAGELEAWAIDGAGVAGEAGSGARASRPISRMAATPTPASSPAAIANRGPIAAEGTSTSGMGRVQGAAARISLP